MKIKIVHLYPRLMNIYGDIGNVICMVKRAQWRGIEPEVVNVNTGDRLPKDYDLVFMGGGQDKGQSLIAKDLQTKAKQLRDSIGEGTPALVICGGYQLFGRHFTTSQNETIKGIDVFGITTKASDIRMIGNIVINSKRFGTLVGFENHSGQTKYIASQEPLGRVIKGYGNNSTDRVEGIIYKNAIGTYMHGSFLPKNPHVADYLLLNALKRRYDIATLSPLEDDLAAKAKQVAIKRPR